jgi:hypothetical protein
VQLPPVEGGGVDEEDHAAPRGPDHVVYRVEEFDEEVEPGVERDQLDAIEYHKGLGIGVQEALDVGEDASDVLGAELARVTHGLVDLEVDRVYACQIVASLQPPAWSAGQH